MGSTQNCSNKKPNGKDIDKENNRPKFLMPPAATTPIQKPSMSSLLIWNVTKALEKKPHMDLKSAIKVAQEGLNCNASDLNFASSECPENLHLTCAILAWQQLGHGNAESLYEFIEAQKKNILQSSGVDNIKRNHNCFVESLNITCDKDIISLDDVNTKSFEATSMGPVIKLPQTEIVMRCQQCQTKKNDVSGCSKKTTKPESSRCLGSDCSKKLTEMDAATEELRARLASLAKREAERVQLLERAEAAWVELERGYQRRLALGEEREDDMSRQIKKTMEDRNTNKDACTILAKQLKQAGDAAEKEQAILKVVERDLCGRQCERLRLSKEMQQGEAALTDLQCKLFQLDRDLQFKEEQARRKLLAIDGETESARVLTADAERALRGELAGLRQQIEHVSAQLLEEDNVNKLIKDELEKLRQEKNDMVEDLDGCKTMCDSKMQNKLDELKLKRQQLEKLKEKVIDCQCKVPVDAAVTVQRTPSLAALCKCAPEDKFLESCSCTSLRSRLISDLLADLFGGLQSEMGIASTQMPCQLLKCLEDKHNWDRASIVKTNLRNFFSKLLIGELDIAIATSIENYHAKWVGASCADEARMTPGPKDDLNEGWEQRAIEKRAQKLAAQLAEQLFEKRAAELSKHAKEIVTSGPPPCECNKKPKQSDAAAVLSCLTEPSTPFQHPRIYNPNKSHNLSKRTPFNWEMTQQEVTELKFQIEDLRKKSIKKEDLKLMEKKIAGIVKQATGSENQNFMDVENSHEEVNKKHTKNSTHRNIDESPKRSICYKSGPGTKRKVIESYSKKCCINEKPTKQPKKYDHNQSYAVNLCMCGPIKANKTLQKASLSTNKKSSLSEKKTLERLPEASRSKPINTKMLPLGLMELHSEVRRLSCDQKCKCLQRTPSNSSIDNLLETLNKWKSDLVDPQEINMDNVKSPSITRSYLDNKYSGSMKHKVKNETQVGFIDAPEKHQEHGGSNEMNKNLSEVSTTRVFRFHQAVNTTPIYVSAINLPKINCISGSESKDKVERHENYKKSILKDHRLLSKTPQACEPSNKLDHIDFTKDKILTECKRNDDTAVFSILANSQSINSIKVESTEKSEKLDTASQMNTMPNNTCFISTEPNTILCMKENRSEDLIPINTGSANLFTNKKNETRISPENFDYYIKFLGVTLANTEDQGPIQNKDHICNKDTRSQFKSKRWTKNSQKYKIIDSYYKEIKCDCNSKFEELKTYMINTLENQTKTKKLSQKNKTLHEESLKDAKNTVEQCVCCNTSKASSKDLEENAFHLLEDHLKQRLKEVKTCSCEASCFLPEDEEKIFATILKRVRRVISNCANEYKCTESEGSWKRAYGLLKEYLKIKMNRVQGLQYSNTSNEVILPQILKKVCNLIENDFERLKEICKCKNDLKFLKSDLMKEHISNPTESPDRNTNFSIKKYLTNTFQLFTEKQVKSIENMQNISCQVSTKIWMETKSCEAIREINSINHSLVTQQLQQNSIKTLILTHTASAQVPPDLHMATKSCGIIEMLPGVSMENQYCGNLPLLSENKHTTMTSFPISNKKPQGEEVSFFDCDCSQKYKHNEALKLCRNNEILLDLYSDVLINCDINTRSKQTTKQNFSVGFVNSLPNLKPLQLCETNAKKNNKIEFPVIQPYFGCTIRSNSNDNIISCVCTKSVIENNCYKMNHAWKQFIESAINNFQDRPYVMTGNENEFKKNDNETINTFSAALEYPKKNKDTMNEIDTKTCLQNEENMILNSIMSKYNKIHTEITSLQINAESERPLESLNSSPYSYDESKKSSDDMTSMTTKLSLQNCQCNKVPICHVKMLVENIERNLLQSRCTCDSISKACPVHSNIISQNSREERR